jgi:hypothetical protein
VGLLLLGRVGRFFLWVLASGVFLLDLGSCLLLESLTDLEGYLKSLCRPSLEGAFVGSLTGLDVSYRRRYEISHLPCTCCECTRLS